MLVRMIYASRPVQPFSTANLNAILATARKNNPVHELTGMLVYDHSHFLQVIEGDRSHVNGLLQNLVKDTRHKDFLLIKFSSETSRLFPHWSMGYAPEIVLSRPFLFKYGVATTFNPYILPESKAEAMLAELGELASAGTALAD